MSLEVISETERPQAQPLKECDLVMKGGITSGIVYPPAVLELHEGYRFRGVGGTSAGAIAAAVTAAAEYGRQIALTQGGDPEVPFRKLQKVQEELCRPGVLRGLFQPEPSTRVVMEVVSAAFQSTSTAGTGTASQAQASAVVATASPKVLRTAKKVAGVYGKLLRWTPGWTLGGAAVGFGIATAMNQVSGAPPSPRSWIAPTLAAALGGFAGGLAGTFRALTVDVRDNGFGICSGRPSGSDTAIRYNAARDDESTWGVEKRSGIAEAIIQSNAPAATTPVLTDWLCERIDDIAGVKGGDVPLTFGMLETPEVGVTLRRV